MSKEGILASYSYSVLPVRRAVGPLTFYQLGWSHLAAASRSAQGPVSARPAGSACTGHSSAVGPCLSLGWGGLPSQRPCCWPYHPLAILGRPIVLGIVAGRVA